MSAPTIAIRALAAIVALVGASCGAPAQEDDTTRTERIEAFCTMNPTRDFAAALTIAERSGADAQAAASLSEMVALAFADPPGDIADDVELLIDRSRANSDGPETTDDPDIARAIGHLNTWLADNCGPPEASTGSTGVESVDRKCCQERRMGPQ